MTGTYVLLIRRSGASSLADFGILINKAVKMSISQGRSHARQLMFPMRRISLFFKFVNLLLKDCVQSLRPNNK